jgi:hypothetical protein
MTRAFSSAVIDIGVSFVFRGFGTSRDVVQQSPWRNLLSQIRRVY